MTELTRPRGPAAPVSSASFQALGAIVAQRWADVGHDFVAFPVVAQDALTEARLDRMFQLSALLQEFADGTSGASRGGAMFSDFPLTFYEDARFRVELLIWADSSTEIHDHGFAGAFALMTGESLHGTFTFSPSFEDGPRFAYGDLTLEGAAVLEPGDVRRIDPTPGFIHSAFHLSRPTATLVVRTHGGTAGMVQRTYLAPGLAVACNPTPAIVSTCDALAMLALCDPAAAIDLIRRLVEKGAPELLFALFRRIDWSLLGRANAEAAHCDLLRREFGGLLLHALVEARRVRALMAQRVRFFARDDRLALGAIAIAGSGEAAAALLRGAGLATPERAVAAVLHPHNEGGTPDRR